MASVSLLVKEVRHLPQKRESQLQSSYHSIPQYSILGLVSNVSSTQSEEGPKCGTPAPTQAKQWFTPAIPALGRQGEKDPWLTGQAV